MTIFPGCKCCGGTGKEEECCNCSNEMLQRALWDNITGDYWEDGSTFDSSDFFEADVEVGWGSTVVWSGTISSNLIRNPLGSRGSYYVLQPTSGAYDWVYDDGRPGQKLYEYPIRLLFYLNQNENSGKVVTVEWGNMRSLVYFQCDGITKERLVKVRQPPVSPDTGGACPLGVRSSYSSVSGADDAGNVLTDVDCGVADSVSDTIYDNSSCGLGVISKVFYTYQYHGNDGDRPCFGPGADPDQIPQQYLKVTLRVKDERLGTISPCYTSDKTDPDSLDDGSTTGLCNGRPVDNSLNNDKCDIRKKCDCPAFPPHSTDFYGTDVPFIPGEANTCKCCCFLPTTNTATLDGDFLINESNATFKEGSPYSGVPALVFVTDGTDDTFGDEVRVIAMPTKREFGFSIVDNVAPGNDGYSSLYAEYNRPPCGVFYEWGYLSQITCSRTEYLGFGYDSEHYLPVYRSQPFDPTGPQTFDEWKDEQTELALKASCDTPEWDWNYYVSNWGYLNEYEGDIPFQLLWDAGLSSGEGKTFSDTFQTTDGPMTITGRYEVIQTFDNECGYAGDCEFPTQTSDTITLPVTDEDCCTRGGGTFTPNTGGRTMPQTKTGPGTELAALLKTIGIDAKEKGCQCKSHAKRMDREGPQWCRDNIDTILGWLEKEAKKRKLPFIKTAAKQVVLLAIRRAEKRS